MKKITRLMTILCVLSLGMYTSCESKKEKTEDAETNLKEAAKEFSEAKIEEVADSAKLVSVEEWALFKQSTEAKIQVHEDRISYLKKSLKMSQSEETKETKEMMIKIEALEQKNKSLKNRLKAYEKIQKDWISFKSEFKHDIDQLGKSLKDFAVPSKN